MHLRLSIALAPVLLIVGLTTSASGALPWQSDYHKALEEAKTQHRAVLLDFSAAWCGPCRMMENTTFVDPNVQRVLEGYTLVKIDIDQQPLVAARYKVQAIPACIVLNEFGETVDKHVGYADGPAFKQWLSDASYQDLALTKVSQADALAKRMKSLEAALDQANPAQRNQALTALLEIYCARKGANESAAPDSTDQNAQDKAVENAGNLSPEAGKLVEEILGRFVQRQGPVAAGYLKDPRLAVRILFAKLLTEKAGPAFQFDPWAATPARTAAADAWASRP